MTRLLGETWISHETDHGNRMVKAGALDRSGRIRVVSWVTNLDQIERRGMEWFKGMLRSMRSALIESCGEET